jgi:hypothetical protein
MKKILLPLAALGLALGVTGALAQATDFDTADSDRSGTVSLTEFTLLFPDVSEEEFTLADLDGDNELSPDEYGAFTATGSVGVAPLAPEEQVIPETLAPGESSF